MRNRLFMRILAIETATESCSVALWNDRAIYTFFKECIREHTQHILPMVNKILNQNNTTLDQLDAIAFSRGPGSFTGVRIGIGIVQGLALGAMLPVISISTLATMAQGAWRKTGATRILVAIDARMGEIYWAEYIRNEYGIWQGEETEAILRLDAVAQRIKKLSGEWVIIGTGLQNWINNIGDSSSLKLVNGGLLLPQAEDMLPIACHLLETGHSVAVEYAEPVYLRNEIAWKKHRKM